MAKIKDLSKEEAIALLEFTGIDDSDDFKDQFNKKFLPVETAHTDERVAKKVMGKRMGDLTSKILPIFKAIDPTVSWEKLSEKQMEENLEDLKPLFESKLNELKEQAKSGNDKKVNDLMKQIEDKDKSFLAQKEVTDRLQKEYEDFKNNASNNIRSYKITHKLSELKNKIPWVDGMTEIQKAGYDTVLSQNYQFDLDEQDNLRILDKDGKPLQSKAKAAIAEPFEILDLIADENGLKKKNNAQSGNKIVYSQSETQKKGRSLPAEYLKKVAGRR